jgi:8-hydroxy-5-deazaflavin:NADPH oxidoreductase
MRVGILGSGLMGGKLGTIFARAGHQVVFSYARSNDRLKKLARDAQGNARAGTPGEAAKTAETLLLAVHWSRIDDVLKQAGDLSGKVIITCCLPMDVDNTKLIVGTTTSGAEELAWKVPRAKVVCAFNTVPSEVLFGVFEAKHQAPSRLLKNSFLGVSPTSEAKAGIENKLVIAALKRCATQKQGQNRVFQQPARASFSCS